MAELPFYERPSVIKTDQAFRRYAISYKVEIIEKKGPIVQLEPSKSSIKDLFSDPLNDTKGFEYQITIIVLLKNTSSVKKFDLLQFILIQRQKL